MKYMNALPKIPPERANEWLGKAVHVSWAKKGCVWILKSIDGDNATLETPSTKRKMPAKLSELHATNRQVTYQKMLTPPLKSN